MTSRLAHRSLALWVSVIAIAWTALVGGALAWHLVDDWSIIEQLAAVAHRSSDPRDAKYRDPAALGSSVRRSEFMLHAGAWSVGLVVLWAAALFVRTRRRERHAAEAALRESEERYRSLVELSPDAVLVHCEGLIAYINTPGARIFGASSPAELIGKPIKEFVHPDYWDTVKERVRRVQECREPAPAHELVFKRMNGQDIDVETTSVPILLSGKTASLTIVRDITERRRIMEERLRLEARLQQGQKLESVGRLAGGVAHEFNNMLGVILGYTEMALNQVDPAQPLHDDLEQIHKAATRSADVTRQLLGFARKQIIAPRVVDLNETVAGSLEMLGRLIGEDIRITWQPGTELWATNVDPSQMSQILVDLCLNARDAISGTGHLRIETGNATIDAASCAVHPECLPGQYVFLEVSDDGCGMDSETLARLFEPFFTTKDVGQGAGLGLATVYGIVRQNAGFVTVASEPGFGTTFRIHLPRHAGEALEAPQPAALAMPKARGETILLVEDEPATLGLTKSLIETEGYTVLAAGTPDEAIRLALEYPGEIHLLITDVVMPAIDGQELAARVGALRPNVRSLFMSGYTADIIAKRGVVADGAHVIQKPFARNVLASKVRRVLDGERL